MISDLLCRYGLHRWLKRKATFNPTRLVCRCRRCGSVRVKTVVGRGGHSVIEGTGRLAPTSPITERHSCT